MISACRLPYYSHSLLFHFLFLLCSASLKISSRGSRGAVEIRNSLYFGRCELPRGIVFRKRGTEGCRSLGIVGKKKRWWFFKTKETSRAHVVFFCFVFLAVCFAAIVHCGRTMVYCRKRKKKQMSGVENRQNAMTVPKKNYETRRKAFFWHPLLNDVWTQLLVVWPDDGGCKCKASALKKGRRKGQWVRHTDESFS